METNIVAAYKLRNTEELSTIPNDKPGYYKWWSPDDILQIILDKVGVALEDIEKYLEKKNGYYCIYVGVAIKESLRARIDWHVNQINTPTNVKCGTLSTLRQTISALIGSNMLDTKATNEFIDKLLIEYFASKHPIKSQEAKYEIHQIETALLNSNTLYILNIQDNHHPLSPKGKLKELRKLAKQI